MYLQNIFDPSTSTPNAPITAYCLRISKSFLVTLDTDPTILYITAKLILRKPTPP